MAALRTTSRLFASSKPLFRPGAFSRSYATVDALSQVSASGHASSKTIPESKTSNVQDPSP
ncbi:uncharacterized protein An14g04395, partial [Aspergillus niger]